MIYTIVVLLFGVYIGQEFNSLPSIKALSSSALEYFQTQQSSGWIDWIKK
jgi:hypothetical protein